MGRGQDLQGLVQLVIQPFVEQLDAVDRRQVDAAKALVGEQVHEVLVNRLFLIDFDLPFLDAHNRADDRGGGFDLDLFPADLLEQVGHCGVLRQIDGERLQGLGDRVFAGVIHGADLAAAKVLQDHTFQKVVDVIHAELQVHVPVAFDLPIVLIKADAAGKEDDALERQVTGLFVGGRSGADKTAYTDEGRGRKCREAGFGEVRHRLGSLDWVRFRQSIVSVRLVKVRRVGSTSVGLYDA